VMRSADDRLVRSVLRIAFASQIRPERQWEGEDGDQLNADRDPRYRDDVARAVAAERAWLEAEAGEPAWPSFPRRKRYLRNAGRSKFLNDEDFEPETDGETFVVSQTCARWLRLMTRDDNPADNAWLPTLIAEYEPWTLYANGAGLDPAAEINGHLDEWNSIFFSLFARILPSVPEPDAIDCVRRAIDLPDESFFEIAADLLPCLDALFFNNKGGTLDLLLNLRSVIADRLGQTVGWRRERDRDDLTWEVHIGPAIAVMFFNRLDSLRNVEAYLMPKGLERVEPFLGQLESLIEDGPVPLTSLLTTNLLEVAPNPSHLGFFLSAALTWLKRQPDNARLWIDHGLGTRLTKFLYTIINTDPASAAPDHPARPLIDDLLARLVRIGVPEAHALERTLPPIFA